MTETTVDATSTSSKKKEFGRLGQCEVCAIKAARYTCPRCEVKTCSLECVNIHKSELNCDGIRNRTKFIPLKEMSELDFRNDYYLLEECNRYVNTKKHNIIKSYTHYKRILPSPLNRLRKEARVRSINLRFLLPHFSRHKENTTYFNRTQMKIFWCVKWCFVGDDELKTIYTCMDKRCDEEELLGTLLKKLLDPLKNIKALEKYYKMDIDKDVNVVLLAEGVKHCGERYYLLDVSKTLNENLTRKTLVEYPCLYVLPENGQQLSKLNIIADDEDVEQEVNEYYEKLREVRQVFIEKYGLQTEESKKEMINVDERKDKITNHGCNSTESSSNNNECRETDESKDFRNDKIQEEENVKKRERKRKLEDYYRTSSNFLFSDDKLMDIISSSDDESA